MIDAAATALKTCLGIEANPGPIVMLSRFASPFYLKDNMRRNTMVIPPSHSDDENNYGHIHDK